MSSPSPPEPQEQQELSSEEKSRILQQLLSQGGGGATAAPQAASGGDRRQVSYEAGICMKTRDESGAKFFINICRSEQLPKPPDVSDEKLAMVMEDPDRFGHLFRVPLSIGEGHAERDRTGGACTAYDVVLHADTVARARSSAQWQQFVLSVALEGVESKYGLSLSRDYVLLRNKAYMGCVQQQAAEHFVRTAPKPFIQEMPQQQQPQQQQQQPQQQQRKAAKAERPRFRLLQEPPSGQAEFFVCEIQLPLVATAASLNVEVGGDRLLLTTRNDAYRLDFYLPVGIDRAASVAQFDRDSRQLTVTMPAAA